MKKKTIKGKKASNSASSTVPDINTSAHRDLEILTEALQHQTKIAEEITKNQETLMNEQELAANSLMEDMRKQLHEFKKEEERLNQVRKTFEALKQKHILEGKAEAENLINLAKKEADEIAKNIALSGLSCLAL